MIKITGQAHAALFEYIPQHMHRSIIEYFEQGAEPGSFLRAILENDFMTACATADSINRDHLFGYAVWLANYVPGRPHAWGSREAVDAHLDACHEARTADA